ncbi:hypothetical protein ES288_D02G281100v1, partial [Gossypium darwinii]
RHKKKKGLQLNEFLFSVVLYKYPHQFLHLSTKTITFLSSNSYNFHPLVTEQTSMVSTKILIRMARKWQKLAAIGRRRITSSLVDKGHFVIYTTDKKRFVIPLAFLRNTIFVELLKMSEEEFGLPSDGPITLPCDSVAMNYILSLLQRSLAKYLEKAVLNSVASYRCSSNTSYCHQAHTDQQSLVYGF